MFDTQRTRWAYRVCCCLGPTGASGPWSDPGVANECTTAESTLLTHLESPCHRNSAPLTLVLLGAANYHREIGAVGEVSRVGSETISSLVGLVGVFGWSGPVGDSGALEPVNPAKLRDASGAIRCDAQVQTDHAFKSATGFPFQTVPPNLVIPRLQGTYDQIPKSIVCDNLRRSRNSVLNVYNFAPCERGCERTHFRSTGELHDMV